MDTELLISTIRGDENDPRGHLPSIYEIFLVDQIDNMLKPAFRQFADALQATNTLPSPLSTILRDKWEELYDILILILQWRFIRHSNSTIAEYIYGLQRRSHSSNNPTTATSSNPSSNGHTAPMSKFQQDASIYFFVIVPRLMDLLSKIASIMRLELQHRRQQARHRERELRSSQARIRANGHDDDNDNNTSSSIFSWLFSPADDGNDRSNDNNSNSGEEELDTLIAPDQGTPTATPSLFQRLQLMILTVSTNALDSAHILIAEGFPYAVGAYGVVVTLQRLRYLFGYTEYHHPILERVNTVLVRYDAEKHGHRNSVVGREGEREAREGGNNATERIRNTGAYTLLGLVIVLRVVQWLIQNRHVRNREGIGGPAGGGRAMDSATTLPPAPPPPGIGRGCVVPPQDKLKCPLCRKARVADAVSTGGYLFCRACLMESIQRDVEQGRQPTCPVTGILCREEDVIMCH